MESILVEDGCAVHCGDPRWSAPHARACVRSPQRVEGVEGEYGQGEGAWQQQRRKEVLREDGGRLLRA